MSEDAAAPTPVPEPAPEPAPVLPPRRRSPLVGAVVDYAGLACFLIGWLVTRNLMTATWALVGGSMPLLAGGAALVFGALTLVFHNPVFLKMKPTFMNLAFATALFIGLALKRSPLKMMLGEALEMSDAAWRSLTWRYAFFFLFVAGLNEAVWRTQPDSIWVPFRFPGLLILTFAFSLAQTPFFMRHARMDGSSSAD
jgi:intracellular septation protein